MKARYIFTTLLLVGILFAATVTGAPRYKDRSSTDPGNDLKRVSVQGKVESISGQKALVVTDKGAKVTVNLGPEHYWREKGYNLRTGVVVTVDGWGEIDEGDGGFCYAGEISGDGFQFDLSDSEGYPRWAEDDDDYGWRPSIEFYTYYYGCEPGWYWYSPAPRFWHRWHYTPRFIGPRWGWHDGWHHGGHYGGGHRGGGHGGHNGGHGGRGGGHNDYRDNGGHGDQQRHGRR